MQKIQRKSTQAMTFLMLTSIDAKVLRWGRSLFYHFTNFEDADLYIPTSAMGHEATSPNSFKFVCFQALIGHSVSTFGNVIA